MRDYKNVKVPKSYRSGARRTAVKRVQTGRASSRSEKRGARIRGLLSNILITALLGIALYGGWRGYHMTVTADFFTVAGVDIKGVKHLDEAELRELAAGFTGQNIFRVDIEDAVRRARAIPWVREARVHRRLPNRITMVLTERTPAYLFESGAARYLMDDGAVIIERVPADQLSQWPLPRISIRDCDVRPGAPVTRDGVVDAMQLIDAISSRGGWSTEDIAVRADSPETLTLLYAGHEFKMGRGRYDEKLRRLTEVLADVKQRGMEIASVDLRPRRQAAVTVKKNGGPESRDRGKRL